MEEDQKKVLLERIADLEHELHIREGDLIHDNLTGLKTRAFFEEEIDIYLSAITGSTNASRRKEWFGFKNISILFFDIDHFKTINDTYGHSVGDDVLKEVSLTINQSVREGDTVSRWGGEEIVTSLLGANEVDAKTKAESIRKKIAKLSFESMPGRGVTVSIGISNTESGVTRKELVDQADKALYKAKETGRNRVVAFSELNEILRVRR